MDALNEVAANIRAVSATLPDGVRLVAVSKFHPAEYIREAYDAGQRVFGESREQELAKKVAELPDDIGRGHQSLHALVCLALVTY